MQSNIVSVGYSNLPTPPPTPPPHCVEVSKSACYADSLQHRIMGNWIRKSETMTREECMQLCYSQQKKLAGVEFGVQCMCGDSLKPPEPSNACTMPCAGKSSDLCGGHDAIDIMNFTCSRGRPF